MFTDKEYEYIKSYLELFISRAKVVRKADYAQTQYPFGDIILLPKDGLCLNMMMYLQKQNNLADCERDSLSAH